MRRTLVVAALTLLVSACGDQDPTTPPFHPTDPSPAIVDALNGEGGNPFVFLKPPVVDEPDPSHFRTFDPDLDVVVEVCRLDTSTDPDSCGSLLEANDGSGQEAAYGLLDGPGGETVTVDLTEEEYQVQIHFRLFDLEQDVTYRIQTRVDDAILAFADLEMVGPGQMRNARDGQNLAFANDQLTVPWKVRIDRGALCFADPTCTSTTVTVGDETTVTYTSSDGEEVDLHLPDGWSATVDGVVVDELTFTIQELLAVFGTEADPSCLQFYELNDPLTGQPSNCYDVQADTETGTDVEVVFSAPFPILAFCPDGEVLQAIADGEEGWLMTSIEEDDQGQTTRTYHNVQPETDFGGCILPPPSTQIGLSTSIGYFASAVWRYVGPLVRPLLPTPLYAADLGFGGELTRLSTIFFWSRTAEDVEISPASSTIDVNETVQLTVEPVFHDGGAQGSFDASDVQWSTTNAAVATVDLNGLITGVGTGTVSIIAEVPGVEVLDPNDVYTPLRDTATVTVANQQLLGAIGTATVDGVVGQGEWPSGACQSVTFDLPEGGTTQGEFCFMNDLSNIYVRSSYTRSTDPASTLFFELDMDGDGTVGVDPGDDQIATQQNGGSAFFRDEAVFDGTTFTGVTCGGIACSTEDTQLGGTSDGAGAYGVDNNGLVVFEMSHPLASGDQTQAEEPLDVSLTLPDAILVRFQQHISNGSSEHTNLIINVAVQSPLIDG